MSGKGSRRRPASVPRGTLDDAWARTFGKPKPKPSYFEWGAEIVERSFREASERIRIGPDIGPHIDLTVDGPMPHGDAQLRDAA